AFLIAKMVDWGRLNLLDGHANIYLDGVFKGISYINTRSTNDTLDFSLGIDESVIVIREKVDEFCESKVLGSNKKETLGYKIKVRNSKSAAISVMIQDQIPISTNKEIEIELLESSSAKYEESTGYLSWKHEIPANQTKEILFKYEVKYPKSGSINL
ncbi:MAG: DUF4139 domain-containing protein, partial [Flavobacteriales bacterium]|nr:DUF4139 domain-containing protein [Flavobacteriales bacterium]